MDRRITCFFVVVALFAASAALAEESADWNSVQFINAYASENPDNSEFTIQMTVYDVVGEGLGVANQSQIGFFIFGSSVGPQLCGYTKPLGDFLPSNFFASSVVKDGIESTITLSECSTTIGSFTLPATLSLYCPPGSITHSDSDAMSKTTFPDRTHRFETVKKNEYKGIGDERTSMCNITFTSSEMVKSLPVYWLDIEDSRSRLK